jgi:D-alanyl-D-alanine carboxypeptidase (penicillin-binding protein 5/6)
MKKIAVVLAVIAFFGSEAGKTKKKASTPEEFISAKQAVLMESETEDCLYEKNADERRAPSSMTKLMTLYVLFSEIVAGRVKMDDEFHISEAAQKMQGSRSFFQAGTTARVEDLIRSAAVHSGNDACVAIAEGISGDVDAFAEKMNEVAKKIGLQNTNFTNPTGMPNDEHFSSVRDIAIISKRIIADFPQFYHYFSEKTFTINSITQQNRNTLLGNTLKVDGLKTGKTDSGGYGIAVSAQNNGKRLIAVVNGCKTAKARAQNANKLLAVGFKEFVPVKIAEAGKPIVKIPVWMGTKDQADLCVREDVVASVRKKCAAQLKVEARFKSPVEAPIVLGAKIGELVYKCGNVESKPCDLFACEPVEKVNIFQRMSILLKRLFSGGGSCPKAADATVNIEIAK